MTTESHARRLRDSGPGCLHRIVRLFRSSPKPDDAPKKPDIGDIMQALEDNAFRRAPLGSTLTVLGAEMTVTKHRRYSRGMHGHGISIPTTWPAVVCEYRDNLGVIREYQIEHARFHLLPNVKDETWR